MVTSQATACTYASAWQPQHTHSTINGQPQCRIRCPHHQGDNLSACAIWDKQNGQVAAQCHARRCDYKLILEALGVPNVTFRNKPWITCGINDCRDDVATRVATYDHQDGYKVCVHVIYCPGASCRVKQCDKDPNPIQKKNGKRKKHVRGPGMQKGVLVKLWEDQPDNILVVTEGESDAQALVDQGFPDEGFTPVSWRGGAGKELFAVWTPVAGRTVIFWPDRDDDDEGMVAMQAAAMMAHAADAGDLFMVDLNRMPEVDGAGAADISRDLAQELLVEAPAYKIPEDAQLPSATPAAAIFGLAGDLSYSGQRTLTSTGAAVRLLALCPENLMVALTDTDEAILRVCNPKTGLWKQSEVAVGRLVERSIERWQRAFLNERQQLGLTANQQRRFWAFCEKLRTPAGHSGIISQIPAAVGLLEEDGELDSLKAKGLVVCREADVDADLRCIGAENGVVDLHTGDILPSGQGKLRLVSLSTNVHYEKERHLIDADAAEVVEGLLAHLPQDGRFWIEGFLGHALRGSPDGWAWLVGEGNSGKTTLLEAAQHALGDYAFSIPRNMLAEKRQSDHSEGMHLFTSGARLAIASDILGNVPIESGLIKGLATGDIQNERRAWGRLEGVGESITASMILAFNDNQTPNLNRMADDDAFMRRLRVLDYAPLPEEDRKPRSYRNTFKQDQTYKQAIMAWLVCCAMDHDEIPPDTPGGKNLLAQVIRETVGADFQDWLNKELVFTDVRDDVVPTTELWNKACEYSGTTDTRGNKTAFNITRKTFSGRVRSHFKLGAVGKARVRGASVDVWRGLKWRDSADPESQGGFV